MASRILQAAAKLAWWRRRRAPARPEMGWAEFELLLGEGFRLQGYVVTEMGGEGAADLVLQKGAGRFLVQCRHWRATRVDAGTVRELHAAAAAQGAAGCFLVTSGEFTAEAVELARAARVQLINGARLIVMLEKARQTLTMPPRVEPRLRRGSRPAA